MNVGNIYQEVYELLCGLNSFDLHKIPVSILDDINLKRNSNFKTNIDYDDLYNTDNISEEAFEIYMNLDYKYIMNHQERDFVDGE